MADQDPRADWGELPVDPDEGALLVGRLRVVAESLGDEFAGLSRADAESLIFAAANEVLSVASVVQFVPTFAERRVRQILQAGDPLPGGAARESAVDTRPPAPPERPPPPAAGASPLHGVEQATSPRWPDDFFTTEARRLLEKARSLRLTTLAGSDDSGRATGA